MKITLNQEEIHQAVEAYVRSQINIAQNQEVAIDFTAGRGPDGLTATLDIRTIQVAAPVVAPVAVAAAQPTRRAMPARAPAAATEPAAEPVLAQAVMSPVTEAPTEPVAETEPEQVADVDLLPPGAEPDAPLTEEVRPVGEKKAIFGKPAAAEPAPAEEASQSEASPRPAGKSIFSRAAA